MYNFNSITSSDRFGISQKDAHKVEDLAEQLDYPLEDILNAVREVGFDAEEVEEYINDRYNRY